MFALFFTLFLQYAPTQVQAQPQAQALSVQEKSVWSDTEIEHYIQYNPPFSDPYVATVFSGLLVPSIPVYQIPQIQKEVITSSYFKVSNLDSLLNVSGRLRTYSYIQRDEHQLVKKAPLLILLPGTFSGRDSDRVIYYLKFFGDRGFHVLAIPNPMSVSYIVDLPRAQPGDFTDEAKAVLDMIKSFKKKLGEQEGVAKTHLFGWSYGAFLSVVSVASDSEHIIDGSILAASPPLNVPKSLAKLDHLLDENLHLFYNRPPMLSYLKMGLKFAVAVNGSPLRSEDVALAPGLAVYAGFNMELQNSLETYDRVNGFNKMPFRYDLTAQERLNEGLKLRFRDYYQNYASDLFFKYTSEQKLGSFAYWQRQIIAFQDVDFRVIAAEDDFLNEPEDFNEIYHLMLLPKGGHLGYAPFPWFEKLLENFFRP